ncbi:MAG: bifunctional (p)ppGpp synthetase/guanosine-3',5'-bis(diphosphate) 3'-pyrophosphohydrolase [Candidatus Vogelbacteria bacterium]|nr:bifunctional (p)ppGpp synthetase/guanosine-3',5'-bis(diphosphate) 3'-pyrophosphohydrolase [Candidatus Vogelbacteria bacterium]
MQKTNEQIDSDHEKDVREILNLMVSYRPEDVKLISEAYYFAKNAHIEHKRMSGEPYLVHLVGTAKNLAQMRADPQTIAAGLLHDTLEDTETSPEVLEKKFGADILFLVQGVTKLGKIKYQGIERHAESLRKLFIATAKDIRVILIKLADRLHNITTLQYVRAEKRRRIALETIDIYAPVANRLGMGQMKGALEDAAFPYAYPEEFEETKKIRQIKNEEVLKNLEDIQRILWKRFAKENLTSFKTDFRVKHVYSLHRKLQRHNMDISRIHDIAALRIIIQTVEDCYRVLGIIHNTWRPLPGTLKDYIAVPKINGYQSIHTVIFTGNGGIVEIQIRTEKMHDEAEFGIASHLAYDELGKPDAGGLLGKKLRWLNQLIEWQKSVKGSKEFLENIQTDFFVDQIFVFTPKGDVIELPQGSTPIDFAFMIHSYLGNHVAGAKINGKFMSLDTALKNGDIVEIQSRDNSKPSQKWLEYAKTSMARRRIKASILEQEETKKKIQRTK